jgi:hypothetical protein
LLDIRSPLLPFAFKSPHPPFPKEGGDRMLKNAPNIEVPESRLWRD